jgi:hypothetical protein
MLSAFVNSCEEVSPNPTSTPFAVRLKHWVIRDEDLKVFSTIEKGVVTLAAAHFVAADLATGGLASLVMSLILLLRNIYRFTGRVSPHQARILAFMSRAGQPVSVEDVFRQPTKEGELEWTRETVTAELEGLKEVVTRDGVKKMVEQLKDGRWVLNGV